MHSSRRCGPNADSLIATFIEEQNFLLRAMSSAQYTAHHIDNLADVFVNQKKDVERLQGQTQSIPVRSSNNSTDSRDDAYVSLNEVANETIAKMDHVENCITILHARYIKKVFEPLSEILASMQDLRNRAVESIGDGSVPSLPVMGDYSEALTSIKQLTEQTDVMRSMIQSMKPNQSSSAVAHPLGELLGQLDRVEKGQPATRRQEGRQTTLPEALGNKPSPGVLRALDQVLSHARANEGDHDDPTSLSMHPRLKSPTSAKKTSVSSTKKVDEVIDLDPDSPQKSSSGAHPAWTNNMKMESAEEAKFEDNIDDSDAIHGNSGKARQMRGGMLEESNDEERGTGRRGQLEVGNLPTSNRMRYNLDDQHLGMSNSRISNIVNRMYSHADYEEREVSDRAFNNIFNMNIGASIPEGIEGEDSDDSYEEGDDDTLPGKRKMKTTMTGAPATRKGRRSSSDASQQRDGLGDSSPSVMGVMKDAMCKGVSRTVSYFMGSSQQPANNKDTTGGSAQVSAKKPAPLVMATPLVSAAMMHSAQQQGQSLRSSGRKSKGDDGDGVVDLT